MRAAQFDLKIMYMCCFFEININNKLRQIKIIPNCAAPRAIFIHPYIDVDSHGEVNHICLLLGHASMQQVEEVIHICLLFRSRIYAAG